MLKGLIGKKIGMTQIFDDQGIAYTVTLIEAGPCYVTQVRTPEKEGYSAVQLGFVEINPKRISGGELGHLKSNDIPPMRFLREFSARGHGLKVGDKITVADAFAVGERVDVVGVSKGKGFAGAVKRHHFHGMNATHGTSDRNRAPGSRGSGTTPGRVLKGSRGAGHMGVNRITTHNIRVVMVDVERNLLAINGAVPGSKGSLVLIKEARKQ